KTPEEAKARGASRFVARASRARQKRSCWRLGSSGALALILLSSCGDNTQPFTYSDPSGGKLRLVKTKTTAKSVTLAFEVGDAPLTGYSTGFDLPLDSSKVT